MTFSAFGDRPRVVVTLDDVLADLHRVADVPLETASALLAEVGARLTQLAAVQTALAVRLRSADVSDDVRRDERGGNSRLLNTQDAASLLGVSRHWLYRHAGQLPFTVRLAHRAVKFDEAGLRRFIERHRGGENSLT